MVNQNLNSYKNVCVRSISDYCLYKSSYSSEIRKCHFLINNYLGRSNCLLM